MVVTLVLCATLRGKMAIYRNEFLCIRDESMLGITMDPMGPTGIPWEWESLS